MNQQTYSVDMLDMLDKPICRNATTRYGDLVTVEDAAEICLGTYPDALERARRWLSSETLAQSNANPVESVQRARFNTAYTVLVLARLASNADVPADERDAGKIMFDGMMNAGAMTALATRRMMASPAARMHA
jgi:hypothetical protein